MACSEDRRAESGAARSLSHCRAAGLREDGSLNGDSAQARFGHARDNLVAGTLGEDSACMDNQDVVGGPGFEPGASRSRNLGGFVHRGLFRVF